jgi:DNA-binding NarL/FixJ family response regulator
MFKHDLNRLIGLKIILVDDNLQFRTALKRLLETQFKCEVISEVSDGDEFLNLQTLGYADIVLMDLMMPRLNGYKAMKKLNWQYPYMKVIAITMQYKHAYLRDLIEKGFKGCLFKSNLYENIAEALLRVLDNQLYFPAKFLMKED